MNNRKYERSSSSKKKSTRKITTKAGKSIIILKFVKAHFEPVPEDIDL